jgi:hypothetical protein
MVTQMTKKKKSSTSVQTRLVNVLFRKPRLGFKKVVGKEVSDSENELINQNLLTASSNSL